MARTNMTATRVKPESPELLTLHVLRRERISAHFMRVTLGGGDIASFTPMGFDQWFRLFLPVGDDSLARLPKRLNTLSYLKFLTTSKTSRPVLRNYSVRAYRPDGDQGPELDVDFVLHGSVADGTAGPAATWALSCERGDPVAILDEGIGFNPDPALRHVSLVADETGLPAAAGILAALPEDFRGYAVLEVPEEEDRRHLAAPVGIEIHWIVRGAVEARPGLLAVAATKQLPRSTEPCYGWVVGESRLAAEVRRHWVDSGIPKQHIMFCGYWKASH